MYQTISSHLTKFSVCARFLKLQCDKLQDITDAVTGTIDETSTAVDHVTTATAPDNVFTTSQATAATTNRGVSLSYLAPLALPQKLLILLTCCTIIVSMTHTFKMFYFFCWYICHNLPLLLPRNNALSNSKSKCVAVCSNYDCFS